ncbi:MarR family winged helix-turn-helix transcriptional regulator [Thalassiella azotivora]
MSGWLDDDEQRTWRLYLAMSRRLPEALERQTRADAGMPLTYYIVLAMLSEAPDRSLRMSELAEITNSSASRLSHAVARLEERGWVRRERSPEDGRGNIAVLTDEGMSTVVAAAPGHVGAVRRFIFDAITPEQRACLEDICRSVLTAIGDAGLDASSPSPLAVADEDDATGGSRAADG